MADLPPTVRIEDQVACVEREIALRRNVYKKRVGAGKMKPEQARHELDAMRAVLHTLRTCENAARTVHAALWPVPADGAANSSADGAAVEQPASDVVDDVALAEKRRVGQEVRAMLEEVEAERAAGASEDDVLAPCQRLVESGAIPEAAHEAAKIAALHVARGVPVGLAIQKARDEIRGAETAATS